MGFTAGLRALGIAALAAASFATVAAPSAAAASPSTSASTAATRVVLIAEQQRGKRYAFGAAGPSAFDCSGLVLYSYRRAGVASKLGGGHSGYGMLAWARARHRFSRTDPQVGDVVIYGGGAHVGIYIGHGDVISALNPSQGIRVTGLHALRNAVTGYVHTQLGKASAQTVRAAAAVQIKSVVRTVLTRYFVNLRAGASTATRALATVRPGVRLRLVGTTVKSGKRWDQVSYAGHTYWVRADLVRAG
ncbi:MAG: NlpC/P60 family protein [Candidatus Limnocylindrales bacterium]